MPDSLVPVRDRVSFAKIDEVLPLPDLVGIQRESFDWLLNEGLKGVLEEVSPIEDFTEQFQLSFRNHQFRNSKHSEEECRDKDITFSQPLFVEAEFINKATGEIKEQEVFMGDFPVMTERGTFIINGTERVVVSQLVRSPGVYFSKELDKTTDKDVFISKIIPSRGAWLEFDVDKKDTVGVRIDRKRRQNVTVLLKALGWTTDEILALFGNAQSIQNTLEKDHVETQEEALEDIYRKLRPGEPPTADSARTLIENLFFNPKRYDVARVGRHKVNRKLGPAAGVLLKQLKAHYKQMQELDNPDKKAWDNPRYRVFSEEQKDEKGQPTGPKYKAVLTYEDMLKSIIYLVKLHAGEEGYDPDDIDHFGNRRLRSVGELIQNQLRIGLSRMERVVRERMTTQDVEAITPQTLINIRPVVASIKEFFGTSQLSQFMDQTNPLAGLTHKRRLSALGPGGLSRERAGFEVRDVHPSHYGRMCPIETPEGPNIGLIGTLSTYGRINDYGFIETPYRRVTGGKVTTKIDYLSADEEDKHVIAQANEPLKDDGSFGNAQVLVRRKGGEVDSVTPDEVDYMDVAPRQIVSVGAALIPFLEHDDANRALMGANMQRQAVPLLRAESPLVGTGVEFRAAVDAGDVVIAEESGTVDEASADEIVVRERGGNLRVYDLLKFRRSNQGTCLTQKPLVSAGDKVSKGQVIGDGPSTEAGELGLGKNLVVAYMPWEGHNYEDAIIISERLVKDDVLTSIHIEEHEVDARDTKLGAEEITRDIPNV
ncbi:MAG: DNA-directed RNA polymerase subunit beta, partial [Actinomycetota bacterium]